MGFIEILLRHMDGEIQNHWFSKGFIEILLSHMDGIIQNHWFSSGFIEILLRDMDGIIQNQWKFSMELFKINKFAVCFINIWNHELILSSKLLEIH